MNRIASFSVDHDYIVPGMYISRIDGDITTFDLRTRIPNADNYMDNITMHSVEHMFATIVRNSEIADKVIYFGPMGCQTGFYLLTRDCEPDAVYNVVLSVLEKIVAYDGEMFGASRKECGNYKNLDVDCAKVECEKYLEALRVRGAKFEYPEE
ncbi:MAG: S-ribosylhomocysteine lyase [Clostridia bacterium]|nr:S-ribosylhomocysteine lyase [Clostridia bacterium]